VEAAVKTADPQFIVEVNAAVRECARNYQKFRVLVDAKFASLDASLQLKLDHESPDLSAIENALGDCGTAARTIAKQRGIPEESPQGGDSEAFGVAQKTSGSAMSGGNVAGRAEALRRLGEIAEFFRRTEPHSPVSYLVLRAVHWGNISLGDWLQEVVREDSTLSGLRDLLGIPAPTEPSE
jgi:type VI secretion system protein ImpA